jgi:hypothetical protein
VECNQLIDCQPIISSESHLAIIVDCVGTEQTRAIGIDALATGRIAIRRLCYLPTPELERTARRHSGLAVEPRRAG